MVKLVIAGVLWTLVAVEIGSFLERELAQPTDAARHDGVLPQTVSNDDAKAQAVLKWTAALKWHQARLAPAQAPAPSAETTGLAVGVVWVAFFQTDLAKTLPSTLPAVWQVVGRDGVECVGRAWWRRRDRPVA